ncbi:uncharacterized protein LOC143138656 [Alosa pseudoharengus]|uniref:uncharacterized protein LOC143138656 n=1 Tax=Alosa pseudoharengus TaxID=34774 RepID=UPI003F8BD9B2
MRRSILELLSMRADDVVMEHMKGTARDTLMYDRIGRQLEAKGIARTKAQIITKLKALKRQYTYVVDHNNKSAGASQTECISEPSTSTSEPASTSESSPMPDSDDEGGDTSLNQSVSSIVSPCRSPPRKKARKARAGSMAEMRNLLADLDREVDDRDRQRALENQEREERARRETREDRERESAQLNQRLLDLNTVLQQMVQRMPVPQAHGQYPPQEPAWRPEPRYHRDNGHPSYTDL